MEKRYSHRNTQHKVIIFLIIIVCMALFISSCGTDQKKETSAGKNDKVTPAAVKPIDDTPIGYVSGSYAIDVKNPNALMGDADYCFVGEVQRLLSTNYRDHVQHREKIIGDPYSEYEVKIIIPIKGDNLTEKQVINIFKYGGITEDKKQYMVCEDDFLPAIGDTYVFFAYAQPDGSLIVFGEGSTHAYLDSGTTSKPVIGVLNQGLSLENLKNALAEQIITNRERFKASFK